MIQQHSAPDLPVHYIDWVVFTRDWGTWSEPCQSLEEAQELSGRTGRGPIYRRTWEVEA